MMRRRTQARAASIGIAVAVVGAAGVVSGAQPAEPSSAEAAKRKRDERLNVVVVMTDDQSVESMRVMDEVRSGIGDRGVTFANSFVNWAVCCPSRATFLTGQYAHNHGVRGNSPPSGGFGRFRDRQSLAVWLKRAGYHTTLIGKYLNGYGGAATERYVPPGWSEWYATVVPGQDVYDYRLNENGDLVTYGDDPEDHKSDVITDHAVDVIERRAPRKPFFLAVTYTAPHNDGPNPDSNPPPDCGTGAERPFPPKPAIRHASAFDSEPLPRPPGFNEGDVSDKPADIRALPRLDSAAVANIRRMYRCRLESLLAVDEGVGRIVDALRASGELGRTLIVFTSDNGFLHGEHRIPFGKTKLYEPSIRVPLLMRGPGVKKGKTARDLVINADIASAIVDASGANARLKLDGRSLLRTARHPNRLKGRALLLDTHGYKAVRTARYIYAEHTTGETEMYDLERDPYELRSVHADAAYERVRFRLSKLLDRLVDCRGRSCRQGPAVRVRLKPDKRKGLRCRPSKLKAKLRGRERRITVQATFRAAGKRIRDRKPPFKARIKAAGRRKLRVKAKVELRDGRRATLRKRTRICT